MIGFVTYALDRKITGIGQYTRNLLSALQKIGCSPLVLRSGGGDTVDQTVRLAGARLLPLLLTLGQFEIGLHARKHRLELVHDPTGAGLLMLTPAKRILTIHDDLPNSFPGHSTFLDTLIHRYWLPVATRSLDAILTDSERSKRDIAKYLQVPESKIAVVPLAAGEHFRVMNETEINSILMRLRLERPYILYLGSIEPRKNLLRLLEAYIEVRKWSPKLRLVIVGASNYQKSIPLAQVVDQNGLKDSVVFCGYVADEDLPALYNAADLFCFPSLYEGFGLPVLEAMACGTPVVTSNSSSLPEVAGDAALLVNPYHIGEIAVAMRSVLTNFDLAHDLRERGLRRAHQFSWETTARRTYKVYEQVINQ